MSIESRVIRVIEASGLKGVGTGENPHRTVTAYFTEDGQLLAERDPLPTIIVNSVYEEIKAVIGQTDSASAKDIRQALYAVLAKLAQLKP